MKALRAKAIEALLVAAAKLRAYTLDDPEEARKAYEWFHYYNRSTPATIEEFIDLLEMLAQKIGEVGKDD